LLDVFFGLFLEIGIKTFCRKVRCHFPLLFTAHTIKDRKGGKCLGIRNTADTFVNPVVFTCKEFA
jgi:hypothetical protein